MNLALIILPLLGSTASGLFGIKVGRTGPQSITASLVIITTFLALIVYLGVRLRGTVAIDFDTDSDFIEPIVQQSEPPLTIKKGNINTKSVYE